ncbi:MAG: UDP-3-O-(3-hydroxymyristoyl)glucosamine N-acyltransferase [candidate division Zixibacteria bacterium]|nr:UDP-3-O-(3-hydroxymyristoyl)glucosamine N-acyltransferase [candidate division Zixibacteria bacterium]
MRSSKNKITMTLAEIARQVGATPQGNAQTEISDVAPIERAVFGQISFVANAKYNRHVETTSASALVLLPDVPCSRIPTLRHLNPYLTFAKIIDLFYPEERRVPAGVHPSAIVDSGATVDPSAGIGPMVHIGTGSRIGRDSQIMASAFVGGDVRIGERCLIYPGVRILDDTIIGNDVIIHPGVVIGSDGFGFARTDRGMHKIKQVGWAEIQDNVEIGANTTIDRGALGPTVIGAGTKIDNLVQIAHNVEMGKNCIIVSQVGISGSTKLGDGVVLAGQVGLVGHIELGSGVQVGAQSGVSRSIPSGESWFGYPAREIHQSRRIVAVQDRLPDLWKRLLRLEKKVGVTSDESGE